MNSSEDNHTASAFTSKLTPGADIGVGLVILIIVLLSVSGNGLVLLISYRRRSNVRGSDVLCVNLALLDFFCCILFYPLSIFSSFHHSWLGGRISCIYYGFGCFVLRLCSMLTITVISGLRYLKICHCSVYTAWVKGANVQIACCFICLVASVLSSFPLLGWGEYISEPYGLSCTVSWRGYYTSAKDTFYVVCSFSLSTLIPLLLIVVCQYRIIFTLSLLSCQVSDESIRNKMKHTEKQLSRMFFYISLGFVFAWIPYTTVPLLVFFNKGHQYMDPWVFVLPAVIAKISHVYNPVIYFYCNKNFKKALCHLLCTFQLEQEESGVDTGFREEEQNPRPDDIQLQDRSRPQKKKKSTSQDKSTSRNRSEDNTAEGSGRPEGKPVRICWDFTLDRSTRVLSENEPDHVSTLV